MFFFFKLSGGPHCFVSYTNRRSHQRVRKHPTKLEGLLLEQHKTIIWLRQFSNVAFLRWNMCVFFFSKLTMNTIKIKL